MMIIALTHGGGLRSLAGVYLTGTIVTEIARAMVAFRVCPTLVVSIGRIELARARAMFGFSSKIVIASFASLLVYQTASVIVAAYLGTATLALFARPLALVRHVAVFVHKLAFVLTPTVSSLDAAGRREEVGALLITVARYSAAIALPFLLLLTIMGGPILRIWMGPEYESPVLLAVLALGHLLPIAHAPILSILTGLDRHGRPALMSLAAAVSSACLVWLAVAMLRWGLLGVAGAMCVPLTVLGGVLFPGYACRQLDVGVRRYYAAAWGRTAACALPFALSLAAARLLLPDSPVLALVTGGSLGSGLLFVTYWRWILPPQMRSWIVSGIRRLVPPWARRVRPGSGVIDKMETPWR
jgi:O-antigen/teichoic acid export membrane protein